MKQFIKYLIISAIIAIAFFYVLILAVVQESERLEIGSCQERSVEVLNNVKTVC